MKKLPVKVCIVALSLAWFGLLSVADAATARAVLRDARGVKVGEAALQDTPDGVKISASFTDLPPGDHAFHVHAVGKCEAPFESAGGHFNPTGKQHGRDNPEGRHAGDMPNVVVEPSRRGTIEVTLRGVSLRGQPTSLLDEDGASLVLHEKADDYKSDPGGNAGDRIACGEIKDS